MSDRQGDYKLAEAQQQVDEVVGIMRENMDRVLERDAKLSDLEDRSDELKDGATRFQSSSKKLKKRMWWQNCKWTLALILVILVIIIIIVVHFTKK
eukprot:m.80635 g.80635  ORF g.80635 m.80635 type:complete len:96 (-) comp8626_c0_seq1:228-515(-)